MIVKNRVEAEAETMLDLVHDLEGVMEVLKPLELDIVDEHYERVNDNGRPAYFKARLVLGRKEPHA
jgi:hypothetical protein